MQQLPHHHDTQPSLPAVLAVRADRSRNRLRHGLVSVTPRSRGTIFDRTPLGVDFGDWPAPDVAGWR